MAATTYLPIYHLTTTLQVVIVFSRWGDWSLGMWLLAQGHIACMWRNLDLSITTPSLGGLQGAMMVALTALEHP